MYRNCLLSVIVKYLNPLERQFSELKLNPTQLCNPRGEIHSFTICGRLKESQLNHLDLIDCCKKSFVALLQPNPQPPNFPKLSWQHFDFFLKVSAFQQTFIISLFWYLFLTINIFVSNLFKFWCSCSNFCTNFIKSLFQSF
jgi:hypothetical protein